MAIESWARLLNSRSRSDASAGQKEALPIHVPLLIGLTATTSDVRENDRVDIEYDFPLQKAVVLQDTTEMTLTFHAHLNDIFGKTHVYAMAWPHSFLQDCAGGRSGCVKFGYALAIPTSRSSAARRRMKGTGGHYRRSHVSWVSRLSVQVPLIRFAVTRQDGRMSRIFLSYSSDERAEAACRPILVGEQRLGERRLRRCRPRAWADRRRSLAAALRNAAGRCEAVILLISRAWLASKHLLERVSARGKIWKALHPDPRRRCGRDEGPASAR